MQVGIKFTNFGAYHTLQKSLQAFTVRHVKDCSFYDMVDAWMQSKRHISRSLWFTTTEEKESTPMTLKLEMVLNHVKSQLVRCDSQQGDS